MIQFSKTENGFTCKFTDNELYLRNGTISLPTNSLSLTVDRSDIATFKKAANGDVLFSGHIDEITFDGETADKATIAEKFAACCLAAPGGGVDPEIEERLSAVEYDVDLVGAEVEENGRVTSEALTDLRNITYKNEKVTSEALTELRALLAGVDDRLTETEQGIGDRLTSVENDVDLMGAEVEENGQVTSEALTELRKMTLDNEEVTSEALTELRALLAGIVERLTALDARVTTNETDINTLDTTMSQAVTQLAER